jgi:hypothetical protein
MSNDGKAGDLLAAKYEQIYANWFCEGKSRVAQAELLTKQGDGLEIDRSQPQFGITWALIALWVCWDYVWATFPVFQACGGLFLMQ